VTVQGQNYVTVFIDLERGDSTVIFATPEKDQAALARFCAHLEAQGGSTEGIWEVVCDMSQAFQAGVGEMLSNASLTTNWFHVVGRVTDAMNDVRKTEANAVDLPKSARWATPKGGECDHRRRLRDHGKATVGAGGGYTSSRAVAPDAICQSGQRLGWRNAASRAHAHGVGDIEYQFESII
jgi:transposase